MDEKIRKFHKDLYVDLIKGLQSVRQMTLEKRKKEERDIQVVKGKCKM